MAELNSKDRMLLAHFYELDDWKAFVKLCDAKRLKTAEQILGIDMSQEGSDKRVAMLQGQAYAYEFLLLEIRKIHKQATNES